MPSNFAGRRRVRCPKCTALLTEPQTQIYECPICYTLLLAKEYGVSKSSDNRLRISGGDAEDVQKIIDGGAKLEKASLINNDQELLSGEGENIRRGGVLQPDSNVPLNSSEQSPPGAKLSKHSSPQSSAVSSELSADTPRHVKSGDALPGHGSEHQFFDLDSASHSESDTYLDSPLWSSENANASEAPGISSLVNNPEDSSFVNNSSDSTSTVASLACVERLPDSNRCGQDAINDDKHQTNVLHDCRDKEVGCSNITILDDRENGIGISASSKTLSSNLLVKETAKGDPTDLQSDGNRKEMAANVGKFRLFDLSVFGIYNEEAYNEIRRGTVAHYGNNGNESDSIQSPAENKIGSQISDTAAQSPSSEKDYSVVQSHDVISHFEDNVGVSESPVIDTLNIYTAMTENDKILRNAYQEDTDTRSAGSFKGEAENVGIGSFKDEELLPVCDEDNDALAKARYGDDLTIRELSSGAASVDISFGDWRSQQVPKFSQSALEPDPDANTINEKGTIVVATKEDMDSSWDDDEELTFTSTANGRFKLKETDPIAEGAQDSPGATESNGGSLAKIFPEKPGFPFRTTAMQKLLHRDDQHSSAQTQSSQSLDNNPIIYEAPYVEHYSPLLGKGSQKGSDHTLPLMPEEEESTVPSKKGYNPHVEALEDTEKDTSEVESESPPIAHSSPASNLTNADPSLTQHEQLKEEDRRQVALAEHFHSRKDAESATSPQEDGIMGTMETTDLGTTAPFSQNADYVNRWNANKTGSAEGMPVSLRWKGKGSSTQSISSTEDEGAYGVDSEAGSGAEKEPLREEVVRPIGRPFPDKEGLFGSGQQPRDPAGRVSQRTWVGSSEANRQKTGSGELATSRRTTRSRPSNERLFNQGPLIGADRFPVEEKSSDSEASVWTGLNRPAEQFPGYVGPGSNVNGGELDQRSNYFYNVTADYSSDHSFRSQDVPPRSHYHDYVSNSYGSALGGSTRAYPVQLTPRGSLPLAASHEQVISHPAHTHYCTCSVCIQQQYFLQQSQMHQNTMLLQCADCAAQASSGYQPMHHEMHGHHHIHGLNNSKPSLTPHDSGVLPAQGHRQNRSRGQHNHPVLLARRMKRYPPLPGKGAPPFVLCRHCNQLLQVPEYLPPISLPVQKMHCGACGKTSKFFTSQADNRASWSRVTANASDLHDFVAQDKQRTDIPSVYSSGVVSSVQSLNGKEMLISGQGSQHAWVENRASPRRNAYDVPPTQSDFVGPLHQLRPMAGSGQAPYGSHVRRINGNPASNDTGLYNEGYLSSSPSSASGASPRRHSQMSRDNERLHPLVAGRPPSGDQKLGLDLPAWATMQEQGRSPAEASRVSDGLFQKGASDNRRRVSGTSLQGSVHEFIGDSPRYAHAERFDVTSKAGGRHNVRADGDYSGSSTPRSRIEQGQKLPVAPVSPLIEHFSQDSPSDIPSAEHRHLLQSSGNGSRSTPWSPKSESQTSPPYDPYSQDAFADGERLYDDDRTRFPLQNGSKGPKSFTGLLRRSIKDLGKGGQGGGNRRKVVVNGSSIPEAAIRKAEERAGPIHTGTYWYDYQAGFWGVMGGPCQGILMPFIEEFNSPLARDCAGGKTGILVNGRELHDKDLEILAKRGLPTSSGKAYILDISGALFDDVSGQPLKGLGKLAPSIEKRGRGFGMSPTSGHC